MLGGRYFSLKGKVYKNLEWPRGGSSRQRSGNEARQGVWRSSLRPHPEIISL